MNQAIQVSVPYMPSRRLAPAMLKQMQVGKRLELDDDTAVLRADNHYVAYRTWMSIFLMIEIFYPGQESNLVSWLEQFGYSFD